MAELVSAAEYYQLAGLKALIVKEVMTAKRLLKTKNIPQLLEAAISLKAKEPIELYCKYVEYHADKFSETLEQLSIKGVRRLIKNGHLRLREEILLKRLLVWIREKNLTEDTSAFKLIDYIDYPACVKKYVTYDDLIKPCNLSKSFAKKVKKRLESNEGKPIIFRRGLKSDVY